MSDGWSDYLRDQTPIVPRSPVGSPEWRAEVMEDSQSGIYRYMMAKCGIRVINPPPPYFWLGREAEAM